MKLEDFEYTVEHRNGRNMGHVDSLSQLYTFAIGEEHDEELHDKLVTLQFGDKEIRIKSDISSSVNKDPSFVIMNNKLMRNFDNKLLYVVPRRIKPH